MLIIRNRWSILSVLFFARLTMAFQFQSVAALSPLLAEHYAVGLGDIGLLIGLYLAPGVVVAIPGGAVAAWFGDRRIVAFSMALMLVGGTLIAFGTNWGALVAGRLVAGIGGVVINIVMTKMLADWFVGREIATAMGVFINSWPIGIALALLVLPGLAAIGGLELAWGAVLAAIALGLILVVLVYQPPGKVAGPVVQIKVARLPKLALFLAAIVWALYNTALAMVFSFGPALLSQRGWTLPEASSATSTFIILLSISVPIGGIIVDRTGRRDAVIMASLLAYAVLLPAMLSMPASAVPWMFSAVGLIFGLGAGPIISLPSFILRPEARAFGMGVFYSIYYAVMMAAPPLAGKLADRAGDAGVALMLGALSLVVAMVALGLFRRVGAASMQKR